VKKAQILDRGIGHIDRDDAIFKAILDGMIISDQKSRVVLDANPAACRLLGYSLIEFNNKKLIEFIHPDSQESFNQKIDLFPTSGVLEMEVRLLCKDGSSIFAEWQGTPLNFHDQPEMLSFLHVPDRNKKPDTGLRELIIQHDHEQVGLMMILHTLVSTLDFQPALILEQLQTIIEFSRAGLFAIKNNALIPLALHGSAELENAANFQIPLTDPEFLTISYNGNQPTRISNIWGEKQSAKELRSLLGLV
jgi:PAS domain S-box-containing protein